MNGLMVQNRTAGTKDTTWKRGIIAAYLCVVPGTECSLVVGAHWVHSWSMSLFGFIPFLILEPVLRLLQQWWMRMIHLRNTLLIQAAGSYVGGYYTRWLMWSTWFLFGVWLQCRELHQFLERSNVRWRLVTLCIWVWKREVKVLGGEEEMFPNPVLLLIPLFSCPCAGREVISDSCHLPEPFFVFSHLSFSWFWYMKVICTKPMFVCFPILIENILHRTALECLLGKGRRSEVQVEAFNSDHALMF